MSCHDETRRDLKDMPQEQRGPTVVRDGQNVSEIAAHLYDFVGHVRQRFHKGRDDEWRREE